jgi:hypothetical protein
MPEPSDTGGFETGSVGEALAIAGAAERHFQARPDQFLESG